MNKKKKLLWIINASCENLVKKMLKSKNKNFPLLKKKKKADKRPLIIKKDFHELSLFSTFFFYCFVCFFLFFFFCFQLFVAVIPVQKFIYFFKYIFCAFSSFSNSPRNKGREYNRCGEKERRR